MNDELESLIFNSIDDIYKLNSSKIGEKITSLDIRGIKKKTRTTKDYRYCYRTCSW